MPTSSAPLRVAILAVAESTASTLYGMHDVLVSVGRDWGIITQGAAGESRIDVQIVAASGEAMRVANGRLIEPDSTLDQCGRVDVIAIPDLAIAPEDDVAGRYVAEAKWLREENRRGTSFATACTGALLLGEAGLLDGLDCTTHWGYCEALARRYPNARVHPNRALVVSGDGQRFVMAGGGTSWMDLALYLIARFVGTEEAMRIARLHLIDWHHVGQQPFATLTRNRQAADAVIARCQEWIASHYETDSPVAAMARLSGLAERSFKRRFAQATGMSPLEYVHALRLEETKHMLETSDLPIDAIAAEVGYGDPSFFSRLFRRKVGLTPARYRKRFRSLREAIEHGGQIGPHRD